MLHAGKSVGDLREVAPAEFLLLLEAERTVVGRHHREVVGAQPAPQRSGVVRRPQRRGGDELGALEARPGQVVERQVEVLRAGFCEDVLPRVAGLGDRRQGMGGGQVHDVERAAGDLRQRDRPARGLAFQLRRPGQAVLDRVGAARRDGLRDELVDRDAVFRVHHDRRAGALRLLHGEQDLAVGRVEHARVGHEHLEAGDPGADARFHLLERAVVHVRHDHVEAVVDRAVAVGLLVPLVEGGEQRSALRLHGEVDDRRGAAVRRGLRARLERVRRKRAAEGHLHVRVRVDAAGDHVLPCGVDDHVRVGFGVGRRGGGREGRGARGVIAGEDGGDLLADDQHVGSQRSLGGYHGAAADEQAHGASRSPTKNLCWPARLKTKARSPGSLIMGSPGFRTRPGGGPCRTATGP